MYAFRYVPCINVLCHIYTRETFCCLSPWTWKWPRGREYAEKMDINSRYFLYIHEMRFCSWYLSTAASQNIKRETRGRLYLFPCSCLSFRMSRSSAFFYRRAMTIVLFRVMVRRFRDADVSGYQEWWARSNRERMKEKRPRVTRHTVISIQLYLLISIWLLRV